MTFRTAEERSLEFELVDSTTEAIRYLEHGYPDPLVRWHYHNEYELHYILTSSGKVFVGDYIGEFQPGNLILTGPRLPHNWISELDNCSHYPVRDMVVQFEHQTIENTVKLLPELRELLPLLESARCGIEFQGMQELADFYMRSIRNSTGAMRLGYFLQFMHELARCKHCRALSTLNIGSKINSAGMERINTVVNHVMENYHGNVTLSRMAALVGMNESYFSRFFKKATGNSFNEFLTRIRIGKACELLSTSDRQVTKICYEVGYKNVANFNRRFFECKQMTPSEYRRQAGHRLTRGGLQDGNSA